jgi:hypothetical protein
MACGLLPGASSLNGECGREDLNLRTGSGTTIAQLERCFRRLQLRDSTIVTLAGSLDHQSPLQHLPGFGVILGLWPEWLRNYRWYNNVSVENPFPIPVTAMGQRFEGRDVWRRLLNQREPKLSEQQKLVLGHFNHWEAVHPGHFYGEWVHRWHDLAEGEQLDAFLAHVFDQANQALQDRVPGRYKALVRSHIAVNAESLKQAEMNIRDERTYKLDTTVQPKWKRLRENDPIFLERAFLYAENVTKVVKLTEDGHGVPLSEDEISYEDRWWWMMLRSQVWCKSHEVIQREGIRISSEYYDSPARVYIL